MGWFVTINRKLFAGMLAVLPILATVYLIYWCVTSIEGGLATLLGLFLPDGVYRPGFGLVAGVCMIFLAGMLVETIIVRRMMGWFEKLIYKIPVVKVVYGAIRDLMAFVSLGKESGGGQTVWVSLGVGDFRLLGFVTRDTMAEFPGNGQDRVAVYLPMSYQIGGYTVIVPRSQVTPAGIPFEEAMRFIMTAGVMESKVESKVPVAAQAKGFSQ